MWSRSIYGKNGMAHFEYQIVKLRKFIETFRIYIGRANTQHRRPIHSTGGLYFKGIVRFRYEGGPPPATNIQSNARGYSTQIRFKEMRTMAEIREI